MGFYKIDHWLDESHSEIMNVFEILYNEYRGKDEEDPSSSCSLCFDRKWLLSYDPLNKSNYKIDFWVPFTSQPNITSLAFLLFSSFY